MDGSRTSFAHTLEGRPESEWQPLREHLEAVGELGCEFASAFDAGEWARLAGLWHDLGKYSAAFQRYLRRVGDSDSDVAGTSGRIDHATAGAQHAAASIELLGHILAHIIAGHHSGLLDSRSAGACLEARLKKVVEPWDEAPPALLNRPAPVLPAFVHRTLGRKEAFSVAFFTRMLFSCLVDADFLDTERFMSPGRAAARTVWPPDLLNRLEVALEAHVEALTGCAGPKDHSTRGGAELVNEERARVRAACLAAAPEEPGLFSLTVPTGGGKTLSSLAFALRHARIHGLKRIVYVIPFTSIIEQNADAFREALASATADAEDPVIEHHSNLDVGAETLGSRLATENWDAPLVVTTSVQFYESLFANRTRRCRKVHNLAEAVIVLDEVQTVPVDYLAPALAVLKELASHYRSTVVLCTATQPAVEEREDFSIGLQGVREIIADPPALYRRLKRVDVRDLGRLDDGPLTELLADQEKVLCIVNTRRHARILFEALGEEEGHYHLSALMCPAHRTAILKEIKNRLKGGDTCRVVSTQLIEAGVDIDFPVVYRSLAGLDSIAQAAGRCNRNGREKVGRTFVFRSEHHAAERFVAETANCASQVMPLHDDPLSLDAVNHYFELYYWDQTSRWDSKGILREFRLHQDPALPFLFGFATVAERFQLIEDVGKPVIIPWGKRGAVLCEQLRAHGRRPGRTLLRALQRYTVQLPVWLWNTHVGGAVELVHEQYPVLVSPQLYYSEKTGLDLEREIIDSLIC